MMLSWVLRSQKCFKKIRPTPLHHQQAIEVIQDRMDPHFRGVFFTNFWPYHLNFVAKSDTYQTGNSFPSFVVHFWRDCVKCSLSFLSWQEWHLVWSSAATAHSLQGLVYCAFTAYLGCASLFELLLFSYHLKATCPLAFVISKAFSPPLGIFIFLVK